MRPSRLPLLLVLVLVLLAAGLGTWLLLGPDVPVETAEGVPGADPSTTAEGVAALRGLPGEQGEGARASVSPDELDPAAPPPEDAQWVEVQIVLPPGTPLDEELVVVGTAAGDSAADGGEAGLAGALARSLLGHMGEPRAVFEAHPDAQGRLRVPFLAEAEAATLELRAHYLFLDEPVDVTLPADGPVTLTPRLGGRLLARFALPTRLPADFQLEAMEPGEVQLFGWGMGDGHQARSELGSSLELDVGGLRPGLNYVLNVELADFVDVGETLASIEPGGTLERRFQLVTGAAVRGRVLDEAGAPLAGARVSIESDGPGNRLFGVAVSGGPGLRTEADGTFELRGVAPGQATITASHDGYLDSAPRELELADHQLVEGLELVLPSGARVSGRVTFPDGRPAERARVTLQEKTSRDTGRRQWVLDQDHQERTDDQGRFVFGGLGQGPYEVRVEAEVVSAEAVGERVQRHTGETWRASAEGLQPGVELALVLEPPIVVSGRAVDDTGAAVTSFRVRAGDADEEQVPWRMVAGGDGDELESEDGSFELRTLGRGRWRIALEAADHGDSEPRLVTLPGDTGPFTFVLPRTGRVAGRVLDPGGRALQGAEVRLSRSTGAQRWMGEGETTETDVEGAFHFEGVAPGAVEVVARADDLAPSEPLSLELLPAQPVDGLELLLRLGGTLTGEVYLPDGTADAGRQVMVQQPVSGQGGSGATTDAAGRFRVEHLAPGRYQVAAFPDMDTVPAGEQDPVAMLEQMRMTSAEIRDGEVTHVVLGAPPAAPVALTGVVREAGRPAAGMILMALAEGGAMLESLKSARTAGDGTFALTLPAPGDWILIVGEELGDDGSEFALTVPAGESHHVELEIPTGRIGGRVLAPDGAPAADVQVSLTGGRAVSIFNTSGGREARTDEDGRFAFQRVKPGEYELRAGGDAAAGFFGGGGPGYGMALLSGLVLDQGGALDGLELRLSEAGTIRGVVRRADGSAAVEATVWVRDAAGRVLNTRSWCVTDGAGRFTFRGAGRGRYTVLARSDAAASQEVPVDVSEGVESDVELTLEDGTLLLVAVEDEEGDALRATLRVYDEAGREVSGLASVQDMERVMMEGFSTREQRVGPLPPGRYRVEAVDTDGARAAKPVHLSGQAERRLRLRLKD